MAFQALQRLTAIKSNSFQTRLGSRVACVSVRSVAAIVTSAVPRTAVLFCSCWWRGVLNSVTEHWPQFEISYRQDDVSSLGGKLCEDALQYGRAENESLPCASCWGSLNASLRN